MNPVDPVAQALAGFVHGLRLEDIPPDVSLRARHLFPRYQRELFQRALDRGRVGLAAKAGDWVLKRGDNRFIRLAMQRLGRDHAGP